MSSPLLANLFLHYGMDIWMQRHHPDIPFARYADDGVFHCKTEAQSDMLIRELGKRMKDIGLELHPEKTCKVYVGCGQPKEGIAREFTFLGYDFKRRVLRSRYGVLFHRIAPGASKKAMQVMTQTIKSWRIHRSTGSSLQELAHRYNGDVTRLDQLLRSLFVSSIWLSIVEQLSITTD